MAFRGNQVSLGGDQKGAKKGLDKPPGVPYIHSDRKVKNSKA